MSTLASDFEGAEIDVAGGLKPKFLGPQWSPNIGYVHYFYAPESMSVRTYGEVYAKTDYTFGEDDKFTLRALVFFAPDFSQTGKTATLIAGGGRVKPLEKLRGVRRCGISVFRRSKCTRGSGLDCRALLLLEVTDVRCPLLGHEPFKADECVVRSGFSDGCDARVVGTISLDLTWSKLMNGGFF